MRIQQTLNIAKSEREGEKTKLSLINMEKKLFGFLLLFFIVVSSGTNMIQVDGKTCAKPSKYFHGFCRAGCDAACRKENWPEGHCVGIIFNPRCECRRPC
ncbi:hypothetical protein V2J09_010566 [Rumex salicifolius]